MLRIWTSIESAVWTGNIPSVVLCMKLAAEFLETLWRSRALGCELFADPRTTFGLVLLPSSYKLGKWKLLG